MRSCISGSGSVFAISGSSETKTSSGTSNPAVRAISPAINSAIRAFVPWPAPRNLSTYMPSSSASMIAGSEPPSRSGVTYLVAFTVLIAGHYTRAALDLRLFATQRDERIHFVCTAGGNVTREKRGENHTERYGAECDWISR